MDITFILLALFVIKHFICDFVLQSSSMVVEKGTYGAKGGVEHSLIHAVGTVFVLVAVMEWTIWAHLAALFIGFLDGAIHYHIDWTKSKLSQGLTPADHDFWVWLGADQCLHYLTYVGIIAILVL